MDHKRTVFRALGLSILVSALTFALYDWIERVPPREPEPVHERKLTGTTALATGAPAQIRIEVSHYFRHVSPTEGWPIPAITSRLLSPLRTEKHPPPMERCRALAGDGTYRTWVRPFVEAIGPLGLPEPSADRAADFVGKIRAQWQWIRTAAQQPVAGPPLRILTKHVPRPDLPGTCVTLQVTFFTVVDPFFDDGGLTPELLERRRGKPIPGFLFEISKTVRIDVDPVRLVASEISVSTDVRGHSFRASFAELSGDPALAAFAGDQLFGGHFHIYGADVRHGIAWFDRNVGEGETSEWSAVFRSERSGEPRRFETELHPASPELIAALFRLVERS